MTRLLNGKPQGGLVTDEDLEIAKEILRNKCLIGLIDDFESSTIRFEKYFGWDKRVDSNTRTKCVEAISSRKDNAHTHQTFDEGSYVWDLFKKKK